MTRHSIQFGSKTIEFEIHYSDRKTMGITVNPDMDVQVKAPMDVDIQLILDKFQSTTFV